VQITGGNTSLSMRTLKMIRQLKLKNIVFSFEMSTWLVLLSYRKAIFICTGGKGRRKHKKGRKSEIVYMLDFIKITMFLQYSIFTLCMSD
jgi:hypothetical protein